MTDKTYTFASLLDHDFDRAISIRFAPASKRPGLLLFLAFDQELAKIPRQTSDGLLRRIRVQFWRDALQDAETSGHILAAELKACCESNPGIKGRLYKLLDAHENAFEKNEDPALGWRNISERQTILFDLFSQVLDIESRNIDEEFLQQCGFVYGRCLFLCHQKESEKEMGSSIRDQISEVESAYCLLKNRLTLISSAVRPAFLPLVLVLPYLDLVKASEKKMKLQNLNPMKKVWKLWRTAIKGF